MLLLCLCCRSVTVLWLCFALHNYVRSTHPPASQARSILSAPAMSRNTSRGMHTATAGRTPRGTRSQTTVMDAKRSYTDAFVRPRAFAGRLHVGRWKFHLLTNYSVAPADGSLSISVGWLVTEMPYSISRSCCGFQRRKREAKAKNYSFKRRR